ncbi:MAG: phosphoglycolate phosphatase [Alteromonas sp.]|jgi:phosphoglycolate phosphatase|uniref:phosphoglycolate phosphatase n=1 Tax=unclassified Alteromonas TaxID=2614992 RepID=UPI000509BF69|nr:MULTISPECIES: phosphoglycolate phosphatase [unclassified Alteromonas]
MQPITTFIFDLDGTLVDSVPDLASALNNALNDVGMATFSESTIRNWVGNGARVLVERGLSGNTDANTQQCKSISNELIDHTFQRFLYHYDLNVCRASTLYPHVYDTLSALSRKGYTLALVTNKPKKFIAPIVEAFKVESFFSLFIGGDSLKEKKPSPLPLNHVCKTLNVKANECVMVGDSKNDILAANAASMRSVGLTYGYNYGEDIGAHNPDWVFDDFSRIASITP